jgi:hypothetical protein
MFVKWQGRKRQQPELGGYEGEVRDAAGKTVYNKRGSYLHTRKRADGSIGQDVCWTAVIVEAVRVYGQPRQKHVAVLASITESGIEIDNQRRYFWDVVYDRLDRLGNLITLDDRRKIEAAVARKVPRLSREQHDASVELAKSFLGGLAQQKPWRPPT